MAKSAPLLRHISKRKKTSPGDIKEALRKLLTQGVAKNQEEINKILSNQNYAVNQSKISRLLHKLGAIKTKNIAGKAIYCLPQEPIPQATTTPLNNLVIDIVANESLIIVHTSPGSASVIARLLDYKKQGIGILGTIAGDDTIFIAPKSIKSINQILLELKKILFKS